MIFCVDTSAFLDGWVRYYPPDTFDTLWSQIEDLIGEDRLISPDEVLVELSKKSDEVHEWAKAQEGLFMPLSLEVQDKVTTILSQFPRLVDERKNRSQADPFVIAQAVISDAVVVTGEKNSGRSDRPRIPYVCEELGIECLNFLQFIRRNGWRF